MPLFSWALRDANDRIALLKKFYEITALENSLEMT
jgi:hypothetical protein